MKISIVIPTIKTEEEIADMINDILKTMSSESELIVVPGQRSAAANQNIGLDGAKGDFIIICGDDIYGFHKGWDEKLVTAILLTGASMVGPRLLNPDGTLQATNYFNYDVTDYYVQVKTMITACAAFVKTDLRFDEGFIGSGFEDTDFCRRLGGTFFVANTVKLYHRNEKKNQFNKQNMEYFKSKWGPK